MNSDFKELLQSFAKHDVRYLIVGGYAVILHTQPRYTKDLDIWIEPTTENAVKTAQALREFGVPLIEITEADFANEATQFMIGRPPNAIDFLTSVPGVKFADCWAKKISITDLGFAVHYLSREDLIAAKEFAGRQQDKADVEELRRCGDSDD
jgi:hypothetical protein